MGTPRMMASLMGLLRLDTGDAHHLRIRLDLLVEELAELGRRIAARMERHPPEALADLRVVRRLARLGLQPLDDRRGRSGRREETVPAAIHLHSLHAGL